MKKFSLWLALILGGATFFASCEKDAPIELNPLDTTPYTLNIPSHMPRMRIPDDNPMTVEGVELGRYLFYEKRLSRDGTQSCGSCHNAAFGFSDSGNRFSTGIDGFDGDRNAMAIINLGWSREFFWNGRSPSLEVQAIDPIVNPIEMHNTWSNVEVTLQADTMYQRMFWEAFGTEEVTRLNAVKAIAQFERSMISADSPYDRYFRGDENALTPLEIEGMKLFFSEKAECFHCHTELLMQDNLFHNNGLDFDGSRNMGRYLVTGDTNDIGKFRTPTLRNIELTGPYMHDGRIETLAEVVEHYSSGIRPSSNLQVLLRRPGGLNFDNDEKQALVAFMEALTDTSFINNEAYWDPFQ
ncbi:MAG: cytochrome c peroxidase [Bacteroidota bacterium]